MLSLAHPARAAPPGPAPAVPLFRFGGRGEGEPLVIVSGGLILDNGEAERTFLYRCQDRFLCYAGLLGWRCLFLAVDDSHVALYRARIADLARRFAVIARRTGLFASRAPAEPLFVLADPDDLTVRAADGLSAQLTDPALAAAALNGIGLNQISPSYATLIAGIAALLRRRGLPVDWPEAALRQAADDAMRRHDKAASVALAEEAGPILREAHVPTALLGAADLAALGSWEALAAWFARRTGAPAPAALFVKASRNSAGNLAARIDRQSFGAATAQLLATVRDEALTDPSALAAQVADLRREIDEAPCLAPIPFPLERLAAFKRLQARDRQDIAFLVQPALDPPPGDGRLSGLGFSYTIEPGGRAVPAVVSGQIYGDPEQRHFLGAFVSDTLADEVPEAFRMGVQALAELHAAQGYRGPISFDARLGPDGAYRLIHDCNPRLTGVFPSLAVRAALQSECPTPSVLTLGYRGEFVLPDLDKALDELAAAGLLCTARHPRGAVVLPNLCRADGYDLHLIDMAPAEAERQLAAGHVLAALSTSGLGPARLFR